MGRGVSSILLKRWSTKCTALHMHGDLTTQFGYMFRCRRMHQLHQMQKLIPHWIDVAHAIKCFQQLSLICFAHFLTLFLHVTCKWYLESGHSDSCASAVSVSKFPIMPPPKYSQLTKHWTGLYFKFHTMSAITSDPSRNIEWTSNWIVSDAIHVVDGVLSIVLSVDASADLGEQLFQHWRKLERQQF